eukprot:761799-Hanusia_phi.AAC.1
MVHLPLGWVTSAGLRRPPGTRWAGTVAKPGWGGSPGKIDMTSKNEALETLEFQLPLPPLDASTHRTTPCGHPLPATAPPQNRVTRPQLDSVNPASDPDHPTLSLKFRAPGHHPRPYSEGDGE